MFSRYMSRARSRGERSLSTLGLASRRDAHADAGRTRPGARGAYDTRDTTKYSLRSALHVHRPTCTSRALGRVGRRASARARHAHTQLPGTAYTALGTSTAHLHTTWQHTHTRTNATRHRTNPRTGSGSHIARPRTHDSRHPTPTAAVQATPTTRHTRPAPPPHADRMPHAPATPIARPAPPRDRTRHANATPRNTAPCRVTHPSTHAAAADTAAGVLLLQSPPLLVRQLLSPLLLARQLLSPLLMSPRLLLSPLLLAPLLLSPSPPPGSDGFH